MPPRPPFADPVPARPRSQPASAVAIVIAAAVAISAPLTERWEGYAARPYRDPANISSYCYGETDLRKLIADHVYSKDECGRMLRVRLTRDYAPKIAACLPQLADIRRKAVFGALLDASYNAGPAALCRSPMAVSIRRGQWVAACDYLPRWYVTAQKRVNGQRVGKPFLMPGVVNRRKDERRVCMDGVS